MNKVVISLIVVLFVISLGAGGFAVVLNGKIGTLDSDTQAFKTETAGQFSTVKGDISSVDSSLTSFKSDTAQKFTGVQNDITGVQNSVTSLNSDLSAFKSDTTTKLNSAQNSINSLNTNVADIGTQLDESTMNVRQVYDDVIGSVCQIIGDNALGSGFVYSIQGQTTNIVTCWHCVNNNPNLYVILHDGTTKRATVVGSDRASDVAVIKISGVSNLKPLPLADSSALVPGEPVIVVGNPLGIFETVVYGVISRTNAIVYVAGVGWVANLIQYDAAQNGGNSGGPVFNGEGQVIGIAESSNTAAEGIHDAVSSNKVKRVADALIDTGSFTNCILPGTWSMDDLDPATALERGLNSTFGIIFTQATGVGQVQTDDICTAVDGMAIKDCADLFSYISLYKSVGDTIKLSLIRGSGTNITNLEVSLTLVSGWLDY